MPGHLSASACMLPRLEDSKFENSVNLRTPHAVEEARRRQQVLVEGFRCCLQRSAALRAASLCSIGGCACGAIRCCRLAADVGSENAKSSFFNTLEDSNCAARCL